MAETDRLLPKAEAKALLQLLANSLRSTLTSPSYIDVGELVSASILPVSPSVAITDLINGVLDLATVTKDVVFSNANAVAPDHSKLLGSEIVAGQSTLLAGGQPFPLPLSVGTLSPQIAQADIPGLLAQVFGNIGIARAKLAIEIAWVVLTDPSNPNSVVPEGSGFISTTGLGSPTVALRVPPVFMELRVDTQEHLTSLAQTLYLQATVTFSLTVDDGSGGQTDVSQTVPLPALPFFVLPALIPTVAIMARNPNFNAYAPDPAEMLVVVPSFSPLASLESLNALLLKLQTVFSTLQGVAEVAGFLLGLSDLVNAIPDMPAIRFFSHDALEEFDAIKIKPKPWLSWPWDGDEDFDDKVRSALLIGAPGVTANFYNDESFRKGQGYFQAKTGATCVALFRDLACSSLVAPASIPPDVVSNFVADTGDDDLDWQESMSSFEFEPMLFSVPLTVHVTVQDHGDLEAGAGQWAGTRGEGKRLETFRISTEDETIHFEYMAHIEGQGDTPWVPPGTTLGTPGKRVEGVAIRAKSKLVTIYYQAHRQFHDDGGDPDGRTTDVVSNGTFVGTKNRSKRLEALRVWITSRRLRIPPIGVANF